MALTEFYLEDTETTSHDMVVDWPLTPTHYSRRDVVTFMAQRSGAGGYPHQGYKFNKTIASKAIAFDPDIVRIQLQMRRPLKINVSTNQSVNYPSAPRWVLTSVNLIALVSIIFVLSSSYFLLRSIGSGTLENFLPSLIIVVSFLVVTIAAIRSRIAIHSNFCRVK